MTPRTRPATADDETFLLEVFAHSRDAEFAGLAAADPALLATVLQQQYRSQRAGYAARYPGAERAVILSGDEPVGSIEVHRTTHVWSLLDIAVLREHRAQGVGTAVITALLEDAALAGAAVELEVLPWNPALVLYERLGFTVTSGDPTRLQLTRPPGPVSRT